MNSVKPFSILLLCLAILVFWTFPVQADPPRNVILCIGDGMGPEQVRAGGMFTNGAEGTLVFESFPFQSQVTTYSADDSVTDSAAAATAIACGVKVNNGVISQRTPGDGSDLETVLEWFKSRGKSTGLVTTTYMTHATPACFGAHTGSRNNNSEIASDYINESQPNVLLGGGRYMSVTDTQNAGYTVVTDLSQLQAVNTDTVNFLSGQFGSNHLPYELDGLGSLPHLSQMAETALDILDNDPDGFFLMVEGGRIDHAAHDNRIDRLVREMQEFDHTVQVILNWAALRNDTLIVVTADHETGGLQVITNNGQGVEPTVTWSTGGHTAADVGVWAMGVNAALAENVHNNIDFPTFLEADVLVSSVPSSTLLLR